MSQDGAPVSMLSAAGSCATEDDSPDEDPAWPGMQHGSARPSDDRRDVASDQSSKT